MERALGLILILITTASCTTPEPDPPPAESDVLDGMWTVEFAVETPISSTRSPMQDTIRGKLVLLRNAGMGNVGGIGGRASHSGTYAAPFDQLGFDTYGHGEAPSLAARMFAGDSLRIVLQPGEATSLRMFGRVQEDSARERGCIRTCEVPVLPGDS